ncbi:MAG TPA: hypothetical protein VFW44_15410 [Bryobacteraceae bacterium]|nr:hypothetical protein [Bryobacteraceae bacterium]
MSSANGRELANTRTAIALEDDITQEIELVPALCQKLSPLDRPRFSASRPSRLAPVELPTLPIPAPIASPALAVGEAVAPAHYGLNGAGLVASTEVEFELAGAAECLTSLKSSEPLPAQRQSVAFMRAERPEAADQSMRLGKLSPLRQIVPRLCDEQAAETSAPLPGSDAAPLLVGSGLQTVGASLADLLDALKTSAEDAERSEVDAIHASFCEQPGIALLTAPGEVIVAPAPPGTEFLQSDKLKFIPTEPESRGRAFAVAGPQAPTLAGPSLPPQLLHLEHRPARFRARRKQWSLWPLSLIVITVVILGIVSAAQYFTQDRDSHTASAAAPVLTVKPAATAKTPVIEEHPAARSVEVAGIRIVTGPNKKPQLQFLAINHSASEITGLNIHISVRSVDSDTPLLTTSTLVNALAANQSKEIRAEINTPIQTSQIPDWQSLRTEVLIGRQ